MENHRNKTTKTGRIKTSRIKMSKPAECKPLKTDRIKMAKATGQNDKINSMPKGAMTETV